MHPDAIACRLRLHLTLLETGTQLCPYDYLVKTYKAYNLKLHHVSLECKLNLEEEDDLLNSNSLDDRMKSYVGQVRDISRGKKVDGMLLLVADAPARCGESIASSYTAALNQDMKMMYGQYR